MKEREWWLSSRRMTVWVKERDSVVVDAAPVVRRFVGQHLEKLAAWMQQQGNLQSVQLGQASADHI